MNNSAKERSEKLRRQMILGSGLIAAYSEQGRTTNVVSISISNDGYVV
jgi:hypothetical protein